MGRAFVYRVAAGLLAATVASAGVEREQLLVVQVSDGSVAFIDPATGELNATVRVGLGPNEITLSPDGTMAVVANYGREQVGSTLSVVDVVRARLTRTIRLRHERRLPGEPTEMITYHRPHGLAFTPDSRYVIVACESEGAVLLVSIEEASVVAAIETRQSRPHMVLCDPDGRRAYVSNDGGGSVTVIDLFRRRVEKVIPTGGGAQGMALHPVRNELWVANRATNSISIIDTKNLVEIREFACGAYPVRLAFTPDGSQALCVNYQAGSISVFDTEDHKVLREIELERISSEAMEERPLPREQIKFGLTSLPVEIRMRPDGAVAWVTCRRADRVAEIDTERWTVLRYIDTGREPEGLAWTRWSEEQVQAK